MSLGIKLNSPLQHSEVFSHWQVHVAKSVARKGVKEDDLASKWRDISGGEMCISTLRQLYFSSQKCLGVGEFF